VEFIEDEPRDVWVLPSENEAVSLEEYERGRKANLRD